MHSNDMSQDVAIVNSEKHGFRNKPGLNSTAIQSLCNEYLLYTQCATRFE